MNRSDLLKGFVLTASIAALVGAVLSMASPFAFAITQSSNVVASLGVPTTCEISLSPTSITLPSTAPGSFAPTNNLITDTNNGNSGAYIWIYGNTWTSAANTIGVTNTVWNGAISNVAIIGNQMTAGSTNTLILTSNAPAAGASIYIGANVPNGQAAGTYTQQIDIVNTC